MAITLPPPYNNAPIRPADVTQTMIDLYNVVAQINAGLSPVPINLSGPGGAALIGTTPAGGITSTNVQASLNELDTKKVPFTTLAAIGGATLVGNTPAGGIAATTVQAAINELDAEKTSVATLAASGGAALVGNAPAGGISATTVQAAINELDSEKATIVQVQASSLIEAIGTGTADAILGAYTPAITSLTNGLELYVRTPGANTLTNPTFKADGTTAKTIVKGNGVALQAGDAQAWLTLRYDSTLDQWVLLNPSTPAGTPLIISSINGNQVAGRRNVVINGEGIIDLEKAGGATTIAANGAFQYPVEMWALFNTRTNGTTLSGQRVNSLVAGFRSAIQVTNATAGASVASDVILIENLIEASRVEYFSFGTASAKNLAVSFTAYSTIAGTFSVALQNGPSTRSFVQNYSLLASTPTRITIFVPGDITGTWQTGNALGFKIVFDMGSGSTVQTASLGVWQAGQFFTSTTSTRIAGTAGAAFIVTGVQLEVGGLSTPFEVWPVDQELSDCQRYFAKTFPLATAVGANAGATGSLSIGPPASSAFHLTRWQFPRPMRVSPTTTAFNPAAGAALSWRDFNASTDSLAGYSNACESSVSVFLNNVSPFTPAGNALYYVHVTANARLL